MASMRLLVKSHGEAWWVGGYNDAQAGSHRFDRALRERD